MRWPLTNFYTFSFFFREIVMRTRVHATVSRKKVELPHRFNFGAKTEVSLIKKTEVKTRENITGYFFRIWVASSRRIQAFKVLFHYFSYNLYKNKSSFVAFGWMHWIRYDFVQCLGFWSIFTYTTSWGCWKHLFGIPGVRPMFLKPKLHKESKNGFKTINSSPPL